MERQKASSLVYATWKGSKQFPWHSMCELGLLIRFDILDLEAADQEV